LLCNIGRKQGHERHAKRAGKKNQFRIRHQPDPRFDPCDDVPANIPAEPLAFRRQSGLRQALFSAETPDLRTNQIAVRSYIASHSPHKIRAFHNKRRVVEHTFSQATNGSFMKTRSNFLPGLALLLFFFLPACSHAIPPDDAARHVGETATVEGKVFSVFVSKKNNAFLNIGGDYPNQPFTAAMLAHSAESDLISNAKKYEGKTVAVTGKIQLYKGKPEIIVNSENQIRITD
jgi:hypothetical protein